MTATTSIHTNTLLFEFDAIGTRWAITIYNSKRTKSDFHKVQECIFKKIEVYDILYSRFRNDSLVQKIAQDSAKTYVTNGYKKACVTSRKQHISTAKSYTFTVDSKKLFDFYTTVFYLTNGSFTPCIGQSLIHAGYDAQYSLVPRESSKKNTIASFNELDIHSIDAHNTILTLHPQNTFLEPLVLDFGAAGKGHLVDLLANTLQSHGIESFLINGSGDIAHNNTQEIKVGLEHPNDPSKVVGVATIKNQSICGSATNRRNWGKYHHILNPFSQTSPIHISSTWVVADTTLEADGLATALYLAKPEVLKAEFDFEYLILYTTGRVQKSSDFPGELYTQ